MRTNEKVTTLQEYNDINVRANYFWAKDDKLIDWNDETDLPIGWLHAKARLDQLEFTETFETLDKTMDVKVHRLYINDEFIGELIGAGVVGDVLKCAILVGYN